MAPNIHTINSKMIEKLGFFAVLGIALLVGNRACADDKTQDSVAGARALSQAFRSAASKATPGVVTVLSYGQRIEPRSGETAVPRVDPKNTLTGLGSGVIVSDKGMVITNNHVVADAKRIVIQLYDETQYEAFNVHGDPDSDVATLRIKRDDPFAATEFGDSDSLEIGDWVLAIGSPFKLEATVSAGIISAKNRKLPRIKRGRLLQTDAAINPGNSGGPLVDLDGRVIAISTAIASRNGGYQGIGFAIPINQARWIANELADHGRVRRSTIGTTNAELNARIANKFNLPVHLGVLVYQVTKGSAADRAGIKQLDVIVKFAGEHFADPGDLQEFVERMPVGSKHAVLLSRDGKEVTVEIELDPADEQDAPKQDEPEQDEPKQDASTPEEPVGQEKDGDAIDNDASENR